MTFAHRLIAAAGATILACSLMACAPEPGTGPGTGPAATPGGSDKHDGEQGGTGSPETEWGGGQQPEYEFTTELPESFPSDLFALPEGAQIYDAGERGAGKWFVVLHTDDEEAAAELWGEIIESNGFDARDEGETSEGGRFATLVGDGLSVDALTIAQSDGTVQLSYDLRRG